jgi:DNA-binding IclR family transcriptional regulator
MLKSLSQGLELLGCFTGDRSERSVSEQAAELGLGVGTVSRTAATLPRHGFLIKDGRTGRYTLGFRLWELGCLVVADFDLRTASLPCLRLGSSQGGFPEPHAKGLRLASGTSNAR